MAPQPSSRGRATELYDAVFVYPNLSLHSACVGGNIGLVKYALSNGQSANSVLNGVLPIHAAATSGYETIVRMLIEAGANVNTPRLSRKLSSDKSRGQGLTVGTAGSTALHFAAANGHIAVIELLLACGARPDSVEKMGKTPASVAIEHGHPVAAELLNTAAKNFHEGAIDEATDDDDDARSMTSKGKQRMIKGPLSAPLLPARHNGPYRLAPSASSSSLRTAGAASASSLALPARRLLSSAGSTDSLSKQAAQAIKSRVRTTSPHKKSPATMSERMMRQTSDDRSTLSAPSTSRRPSLPAVFDRAAHSLGMSSTPSPSRPAPLQISHSSLAHPRMRSGTGSSSRTLASVFTRKTDGSTSPGEDYGEWSSNGGSPPLASGSDLPSSSDMATSSGYPTPRRGMSEEDLHQVDRTALGLPAPPATAPAHQTGFPPNVQGIPQSASSPHISAAAYRPRKASQLSSGAIHSLTEIRKSSPDGTVIEDDDEDHEGEGRGSTLHRRTSSSTSQKVTNFFGRMSRNSSRRSSFSDKGRSARPSFTSNESERSAFREATVAPEDRLEQALDDVEADEVHDQEAIDRFPGRSVREVAHRPSNRSRGDSVTSTSSSTSRFTGPTPLSPLASSSDHLHPIDATSDRTMTKTRPSRSGSTATDPDLRQVALGNAAMASSSANASILSGSPGSASSAAHSSTHSTHSTAATSAIWSSASTHASKPDALRPTKQRTITSRSAGNDPPRTPTGELITPSLAHSLVQKAQQDLLSYDPSNASSSLSEQLAALGEKLSIEREVKAAAAAGMASGKTAAPTPYVWEKLGKDGTRTPVPRSERRTAVPAVGTSGHRGKAFQQVQNEFGHATRPNHHAAAQANLGNAAQKIYDQRSTSLSSTAKEHYLVPPPHILHEPKRSVSSELRRPKSIDRRSPEPSSAGSSLVEAPKSSTSRQHRSRRSSPTNAMSDTNELYRSTSKVSTATYEQPTPQVFVPQSVETVRSNSSGHSTAGGGKMKRFMQAFTGGR